MLVQDVIARAARVTPQVNVLDVEYRITAKAATSNLDRTSIVAYSFEGRRTSTGPTWSSVTATGSHTATWTGADEPPPEEPPLDRWLDETGLIHAEARRGCRGDSSFHRQEPHVLLPGRQGPEPGLPL